MGTSYRETDQLHTKSRSKAKWVTMGNEGTLLQLMVSHFLFQFKPDA